MMFAALPDGPIAPVSLAAGPALLHAATTSQPSRLLRLVSIPWNAEALVRRHRRLLGTVGIFSAGAAFGIGFTLGTNLSGAVAALIGLVELMEGCVLAFPRPVASPRPEGPVVPLPPAGARQ
jgi:hypothetical protein